MIKISRTFCFNLSEHEEGVCLYNEALELNNPYVCTFLIGYPNNCLEHFLENNYGNPKFCDEFRSNDSKIMCSSIINTEVSHCSRIEEEATRKNCIWRIAEKNKDPSICENLKDDKMMYPFCIERSSSKE